MKKTLFAAMVLMLALVLCACSQQPPDGLKKETAEEAVVIPAEPEESAALQFIGTLYFAYGDTGLMRQETRQITMLPNETREKALVRALLEGSREAGSRALFPDKAEVLSTQAQEGVIYITFNEAFYDRYTDGEAEENRGRMALDALTATLTESGEYRSVQVLVRAEENIGRSMRLTSRFLGEEPETVLPPCTRQSASLPTPAAYAAHLLMAWQERSAEALSPFVSAREGQLLAEDLSAAMALTDFTVHEGTAGPDGSYAVVCADLTLRDAAGGERALSSYPLRLIREGGAWKIQRSHLAAVMGDHDE